MIDGKRERFGLKLKGSGCKIGLHIEKPGGWKE